jgi:hypothetical protein
MKSKEPCGCAHDGISWLTLCEQHEAEFLITHAQWAADHFRGHGGPANFQNLERQTAALINSEQTK